MAEYNERLIPEELSKYLVDNRLFDGELDFFIASGMEFCWKNVVVYTRGRIDGKLIAHEIYNQGTIKVVGTLEIEPLFS